MTTCPTHPSRLRLTGFAAAQVALFVPLARAVLVLGRRRVLIIVWVGLLILAVPSRRRWLANGHRTDGGEGARTAAAGAVPPARRGPALRRLRTGAVDPMTWRDLGWTLVRSPLGFAVSLTVVVLLLGWS